MTELAVLTPALALAGALAVCLGRTPRDADRINVAAAIVTATAALALAATALARAGEPPLRTRWLEIDGASGVLIAVIAVVGLCSALVSPSYLRTAGRSWFTAARSRRAYYVALHVFWAALLVVPIAGNLAVTWLVVEATTAASALLVAFTGRREALEAGWKYLVLTTLGLSVALLGIVVLAIGQARLGHTGLGALDWAELERAAAALPHEPTLVAFVLIVAGLATKIGWAPVHNWLPDAHSEAPAPISALLSAALLPTVLLVAWRVKSALSAAVGPGTAGALFIGFGLASMIVAVPFLWRPLPWKRLLAYSSLEHMGVIPRGHSTRPIPSADGSPRGATAPPRCGPPSQELRALLRLRGPLMFVLLRQLAATRRDARLQRGGPRSLAVRHVDAGSCNGCEHELGAAASPLYDLPRHGLDIVASPRHADVLLVTGPVTTRMATALRRAYEAMPEPRLVAALGDCALGCNVLGDAAELVGSLEAVLPVDIRIPGCPPTPAAIAEHLHAGLGRGY